LGKNLSKYSKSERKEIKKKRISKLKFKQKLLNIFFTCYKPLSLSTAHTHTQMAALRVFKFPLKKT